MRSRDSNLEMKLGRLWKDIVNAKVKVNKQQVYIDILSSLRKEDFLDYFYKHVI